MRKSKSGVVRDTALAAPVHRRCDGGCHAYSKAATAYAGGCVMRPNSNAPGRPGDFKNMAVVRLVA